MNAYIESTNNPVIIMACLIAMALQSLAGAALALLVSAIDATACLILAIADAWKPMALTAGIIGAVLLCVAVPQLPIGLVIVAAFGWVTHPR
jgi:hypothetical protein